jgi:RNase H-fold protein (predicted Holliday junction resolvase)
MGEPVVLAVDPGRDKCGLAVVSRDGAVLHHSVASRDGLVGAVRALEQQYGPAAIVIGDRTGSQGCRADLSGLVESPIVFVAEHGTTIRARERYFRDNPPRGWLRLLPSGLRVPPGPIDDYAAVLLAEAYWSEPLAGGNR